MLNSEGFVPEASIPEKWKFITVIVKNTDILPETQPEANSCSLHIP